MVVGQLLGTAAAPVAVLVVVMVVGQLLGTAAAPVAVGQIAANTTTAAGSIEPAAAFLDTASA